MLGRPDLPARQRDKSKDPNFWSLRVNRDLRIVVHRTRESILLAYVDHHDKAYDWAERRRIEAHPKTGAIQIVEVRERVEEIRPELPLESLGPPASGRHPLRRARSAASAGGTPAVPEKKQNPPPNPVSVL
ncbi:MAG TPA: hypothetical protein VHX61_09250 [Rhizomicrobium sp.]|nr:hypothetical protein [Rhizomicrobium sp.]